MALTALYEFPITGTIALPPRGIGLLADGSGVTSYIEDSKLFVVKWTVSGPIVTQLAERASSSGLGVSKDGIRVAIVWIESGTRSVRVIDDVFGNRVTHLVGLAGTSSPGPAIAVGPQGPVATWVVTGSNDAPGDGMISIGGLPGVIAIPGTCINVAPRIDALGTPLLCWRNSISKGNNTVQLQSYAPGALVYTLGNGADPELAVSPYRTSISGHSGGKVRVWTMPTDLRGVIPYTVGGSAFGHLTESNGVRLCSMSTWPTPEAAMDKHTNPELRGLCVAADFGQGWTLTYPFGQGGGLLTSWGVTLEGDQAFSVLRTEKFMYGRFWNVRD